MTDFKTAKQALITAIGIWRRVWEVSSIGVGGDTPVARTWQAVEDAITALDNAAYDRAFQLAGAGEYLREMQADIEHLTTERDLARTEFKREATDAGRLARERNEARLELADARTDRKNAFALVKMELARGVRLTKALETLADRYHQQLCRGRAVPHSRANCPVRPSAVKQAEKALAGESEDVKPFADISWCTDGCPKCSPTKKSAESESEHADVSTAKLTGGEITIDGVLHDVLPNGCLIPRSSAAASDTVRKTARMLFDDRKPKEQPEIEAVLMGNAIKCACGCLQIILAGEPAYRSPQTPSRSMQPLYATEECARKAARPKARTHPPYAAYTDAMRRLEDWIPPQEIRLKQPAPPKMKVVYECSNPSLYPYDPGYATPPCGWTGGVRDLSPKGVCPLCWHEVRVVERQP